jgi:uncharacterized protein YrzB (UPF0473 family)
MALGCVGIQGVSAVYAAEIIPVYLNGEQIVFDSNDAQPQIFSNRTYVPIRKTAESLGLTIDWNSKTETLTFTREGITVAHTMRSDIVYVNGEPVRFDTKSINKNNRTLMPVRMLAESIGADVEWDSTKRCVNITTSTPKVEAVSASQTVIASGTEVTLTAATTGGATSVKFVDADTNASVGEVTQYTEDSTGTRTFTCKVTPTNTTSDSIVKNYYVYAGTSSGYIESLESCGKIVVMVSSDTTTTTTETTTETTTKSTSDSSLGVQDDYVSDYMKSLKVSSTTVDIDDYVTLTAKTTTDVNRIKVTNNFSDKNAVVSTFTKDGDYRTFTIKTKLTQKGTIKLYVCVSTEDGGYEDDYQTVTVKVVDDDDDSDTDYGDLEIIDIDTPIEDVYKGETARIIVYTSKDITEVSVYDSDDERLASTVSTSKKYSNKYKWTLSFEMESDDTEKYTVYAYDEDGNETKESFKLEGESYSKNSLVLLDVTQKTKDVEEGEDCTLVVRTTKSAEKVVIKTKGGKELGSSTKSSSSSGSVKEFKVTIEAGDSDDTYVAYAYDDDDNSSSRKFELDVNEAELPEINSIDVSDSTVDEGDDVDVTVYTNKAVEKIWIEDSSGDKVSKRLTKPDKETSDEYVWELDFTADKSGSRVSYLVVAQGEDKDDTDEYDFKIKVED